MVRNWVTGQDRSQKCTYPLALMKPSSIIILQFLCCKFILSSGIISPMRDVWYFGNEQILRYYTNLLHSAKSHTAFVIYENNTSNTSFAHIPWIVSCKVRRCFIPVTARTAYPFLSVTHIFLFCQLEFYFQILIHTTAICPYK